MRRSSRIAARRKSTCGGPTSFWPRPKAAAPPRSCAARANRSLWCGDGRRERPRDAREAWEAAVLPLNYARKLLILCWNSDPPSRFPLSNPCQLWALPRSYTAILRPANAQQSPHPYLYGMSVLDTDYDAEIGEFWQDFGEDQPLGLFAQLPINFVLLNLAKFFGGQSSAYLKYAKSDEDLEFEKRLGPKFSGGLQRACLEASPRRNLLKTLIRVSY